jgi:hypothetical protein
MITNYEPVARSYVRSYPAITTKFCYFYFTMVQLRNSYNTISFMDGFSESDLVVLTSTLNEDLSPDILP